MAPPKASYHHGDLRRALMDAALATVAEGGVASLSLRQAARRAGVSPAAPYHHFASVDALVQALCNEGFAGLEKTMAARAAAAGPAPQARMQALGRAYVEYATSHPAHFRLMFSGPAPELAAPAADTVPAFDQLIAGIRDLQEARLAPRGPVAPLALLAWSLVHGLACLRIDGPLTGGLMELPADGLETSLTHTLVASLAALAGVQDERGDREAPPAAET